MATSPLGALPSFANIPQPAPFNPLEALLGGFQQGVGLAQLPQKLQNDALNQQIAQALQMAKLKELQNPTPEIINAGGNLFVRDATAPNGIRSIFTPTAQSSQKFFETPVGMLTQDAKGNLVNAFPFSEKTAKITAQQEGEFIVRRDSQTGLEVGREPIQKGKKFVDRGALGAGFLDETTQSFTPIPGTVASAPTKPIGTMQGYDTKTGTFGIFTPDETGNFAPGIVPSSQAPKTAENKPLPVTQSDQFTGLNLLDKRLDEIEKFPKSVRKSNVGWIDSLIGTVQSVTGMGKDSKITTNDAFRTAVDSLVAEFSFGRGGKALTVNEKEILDKYLPKLVKSDAAFESRLVSFRQLVDELRQARIESLEASGYNVDKFKTSQPGSMATPTTPIRSGRFEILPPEPE